MIFLWLLSVCGFILVTMSGMLLFICYVDELLIMIVLDLMVCGVYLVEIGDLIFMNMMLILLKYLFLSICMLWNFWFYVIVLLVERDEVNIVNFVIGNLCVVRMLSILVLIRLVVLMMVTLYLLDILYF